MISRTDDPAIKMESTRIFVNCIRTLAGGDQSSALGPFATQRVVASLTEMLRTADQYPVLVNEALVALALLVTFGGESAGEVVLVSALFVTLEASSRVLEQVKTCAKGYRSSIPCPLRAKNLGLSIQCALFCLAQKIPKAQRKFEPILSHC